MDGTFTSVPFKAESSSGFVECNGIAKFSEAGIVFEFESKFLGLFGGEVREVRVGLDEISDIRFRKGFFRFFSSIRLKLRHFSKMSKLPHEDGKIKLKIRREDFFVAREAVDRMLFHLGRLPGELPPAQTSVGELFDTERLDTNPLTEDERRDRKLEP